ncbi:hypothetical protein [Ferrovum sp.]|uniref:hypothetical protein n=1 Tax=Ferrovum sp. TaxID=2609467 RepID=UPI0026168648|nr:hypothetical protein [Ferrovum sp.]
MDLRMLEKLETPTLLLLKEEIEKMLNDRLDSSLTPGKIAEFTARNGEICLCRIDKINHKTAIGIIITPERLSGSRFRVSKELLRVKPVKRELPISRPAPIKVVPVTPVSDHW